MSSRNIDVSEPKPKVNAQQLQQFKQKTVTLVCEKISVQAQVLKAKASDGQEVQVDINQLRVPETQFLEVEGVVTGDNTVKAKKIVSFGQQVDMFAYNEMCKMLHGKAREMIL
jgi:hypothetical protein